MVGIEWVNVCKLFYIAVSPLGNVQQVLDQVSSFEKLDTSRVTTLQRVFFSGLWGGKCKVN